MKRLYYTLAFIAGMGLVACGNATDEATAEATSESNTEASADSNNSMAENAVKEEEVSE